MTTEVPMVEPDIDAGKVLREILDPQSMAEQYVISAVADYLSEYGLFALIEMIARPHLGSSHLASAGVVSLLGKAGLAVSQRSDRTTRMESV